MAKSRSHALRDYTIRRVLMMIPTFVGITVVTFLLCQFVPGGPLERIEQQMMGAAAGGEMGSGSGRGGMDSTITPQQREVLEKYYGFDKPIPIRYAVWMLNIMQGDLGESFQYNRPVIELVIQRLPISLYFGIITTIFTYSICIPLGILKAMKHRTAIDNMTSILIFIGYAVPGFALGAVMLSIFAVKYQWFPLSGFRGEGFADMSFIEQVKDQLHHTILPLISYLIGSFAVMTLLMKNSLMENMSADYVKTALAKGLRWRRAIFVHALRNSLIPLATSFGNLISLLLTGSLLIERVFNIDGIGMLTFDALQQRDYTVVLGVIVIGSVLLLVGNLLSDLCVAAVDPRVRFE